jgi:hypothetical protein
MKKAFPAIVLFFFVLFVSADLFAKTIQMTKGAVSMSSKERWNNNIFTWSINNFDVEKAKGKVPLKGDFNYIKINNVQGTHKEGAPVLPYKSFLLSATGSKKVQIKIESYGEKIFKQYRPVPAERRPCRCAKDKTSQAVWNKSLYKDSGKLAEISYIGDYRGEKLYHLIVKSHRFKEGRGLFAYSKVQVELKGLRPFTSGLKEQNKKYVIVYDKSLEAGAKAIRDWKESLGFDVQIYNQDKIKLELQKFFKGLYVKTSFQYALILGHEESVPPHYIKTSSNRETPSDLPYFLMGEKEDQIPDVFYGRVVAQTNQEVFQQLNKWQEYEQRSWKRKGGEKTHVGIASNEGWNPTDIEYLEAMFKPFEVGFNWSTLSFHQDNQGSTSENINKALSNGAMWMNYIGHGVGDSWPSINRGEYHSRHIKEIREGGVKPVIIDVACQNGRFNYEGRLGERFVNETRNGEPIGAVAYYGGSVDISWDPPAIMAIGISRQVAKKENLSLFEVILRGQQFLISSYDDSNGALENLRWYHLFGDPSLSTQY